MGTAVHTLGELWHASESFEVSFGLAPEDRSGQYLGVFGLGAAVSDVVAPLFLTTVCIGWGARGWLLVGAVLAVAGRLVPPTVRGTHQCRPSPPSRPDGDHPTAPPAPGSPGLGAAVARRQLPESIVRETTGRDVER